MDLKELIAKIDELKEELDSLRPIQEEFQKKLDEKVRLEWNYHSNKLEGNELTFGETRELLEYDRTSGKSWKDHRQIKGHDEAISYIKDQIQGNALLTEKFIRELNKMVLKEPFMKNAETEDGKPTQKKVLPGQYKTSPNHVRTKAGDIFKFTEPHDVPQEMENLISLFRNKEQNEEHPLLFAGKLHYRFVKIHPFDDGNGRVARLLLNYVLMKYGYPPIVIKSEQKEEYLSSLRKADIGEFEPFFQFIGQCLIESLELYIAGAKGEEIGEYADLDKRLKVLKVALAQDELDEIKEKRSKKLQIERFEDSVWPLFKAYANRIESFYDLFAEHELQYRIDTHSFSKNLKISEIKPELDEPVNKNTNFRELGIEIHLKGFKKSGVQPLSTYLRLGVEFQDYLYIVNPENKGDKKLPTIKKLYHNALSKDDIQNFVYKAGSNLLNQLEQHYERIRNDG